MGKRKREESLFESIPFDEEQLAKNPALSEGFKTLKNHRLATPTHCRILASTDQNTGVLVTSILQLHQYQIPQMEYADWLLAFKNEAPLMTEVIIEMKTQKRLSDRLRMLLNTKEPKIRSIALAYVVLCSLPSIHHDARKLICGAGERALDYARLLTFLVKNNIDNRTFYFQDISKLGERAITLLSELQAYLQANPNTSRQFISGVTTLFVFPELLQPHIFTILLQVGKKSTRVAEKLIYLYRNGFIFDRDHIVALQEAGKHAADVFEAIGYLMGGTFNSTGRRQQNDVCNEDVEILLQHPKEAKTIVPGLAVLRAHNLVEDPTDPNVQLLFKLTSVQNMADCMVLLAKANILNDVTRNALLSADTFASNLKRWLKGLSDIQLLNQNNVIKVCAIRAENQEALYTITVINRLKPLSQEEQVAFIERAAQIQAFRFPHVGIQDENFASEVIRLVTTVQVEALIQHYNAYCRQRENQEIALRILRSFPQEVQFPANVRDLFIQRAEQIALIYEEWLWIPAFLIRQNLANAIVHCLTTVEPNQLIHALSTVIIQTMARLGIRGNAVFMDNPTQPQFNPAQSTHTASVHASVSESALRLKTRYISGFQVQTIFTAILKWYEILKSSTDPKTRIASYGLVLVLGTNQNQGQHGLFVDPVSQVSLQQLILLIWLAIHDLNAVCTNPSTQQQPSLDERLTALQRGLYEIAQEYNLDEEGRARAENLRNRPACAPGSFNKLIEVMVSILNDAEIRFVTKEQATDRFQFFVCNIAIEYVRKNLSAIELLMHADHYDESKRTYSLEAIWPYMKSEVENKFFDEYKEAFPQGKQSFDFRALFESGPYVEIKEETIFPLLLNSTQLKSASSDVNEEITQVLSHSDQLQENCAGLLRQQGIFAFATPLASNLRPPSASNLNDSISPPLSPAA